MTLRQSCAAPTACPMRISGVHRRVISSWANVAGWPENHAQRLMSRKRAGITCRCASRTNSRAIQTAACGCASSATSATTCSQAGARFGARGKRVCDLPSKQLAVRQSRDRTNERFRRQSSQPHRHVGRGRHVGKGAAIDHACKRPRGIEPRLRDGQCEQQRGKAFGEIRNARVTHCQGTHRFLEARMISPEPTFEQIATPGLPARGQQESRGHDNNSASTDPRRPAARWQIRLSLRVLRFHPGLNPGARVKYRASNPGSAQPSTWSPPSLLLPGSPIACFARVRNSGPRPADTSDMGCLLPASPSNFSDLSDGPFKDPRYRWVMSPTTRVLSARRVAAPPLQA